MPIVKQWDLALLTCIGFASLTLVQGDDGKRDGPMQTVFYIATAVFIVLVVVACLCCCGVCCACAYNLQMPEERQNTVISKLHEWESKGYLPKLNDEAQKKPTATPKDIPVGNSQGDRPTDASPAEANAKSHTPALESSAANPPNLKAEESPGKGKADFLREAHRLVNEGGNRSQPKLARTLEAEEQV
mmetsp:Transcript_16847/g.39126  ORF Transcript_16847/g.39126 Transcript_16847/m.39126 type:complete len:188 (-) Transcript_16847:7-570(-)